MNHNPNSTTHAQDAARIALGLMLATAGTSHLTFARDPFKAQVPDWAPFHPDTVVLQSGVMEILLGAALVLLPRRKSLLGKLTGAFFVAVFPGNITQYTHRRSAFGLDTDRKRFARLFFQPLLMLWALWSTTAPHPGTAAPHPELNDAAQMIPNHGPRTQRIPSAAEISRAEVSPGEKDRVMGPAPAARQCILNPE
jgi:uncharacterized membrane protein